MNTRLIAIVAIVAVVICGGVAAGYVLLGGWDSESHLTSTYSYGYTIELDTPAYMVDEFGEIQINLGYFDGQLSDLFTLWDSYGNEMELEPIGTVQTYLYWFDFYTDPGVTIDVNDLRFGVDDVSLGLSEDKDEYGWVSAYVDYEGKILHSVLTSESVITDENGYAHMTLAVITDEVHIFPYFTGPIEWTLREV